MNKVSGTSKIAAAAVKTASPKKTPAKSVSKTGQTQDKGDDTGKQGDATAKPMELRGGTKQVLITNEAITPRGGAPRQPEEYPFADLQPAKKGPHGIEGPSFFIPKSDNPDAKLATARKRYKDRRFWSRNMMGKIDGKGEDVAGMRIWLAPVAA